MDKASARRLVEQTFRSSFDRGRFSTFVREILNRYEERTTQFSKGSIPDAFKPHVKSAERLGIYKTPDGEIVDLLIVRLEADTKLARAAQLRRVPPEPRWRGRSADRLRITRRQNLALLVRPARSRHCGDGLRQVRHPERAHPGAAPVVPRRRRRKLPHRAEPLPEPPHDDGRPARALRHRGGVQRRSGHRRVL